MGKKISTTKTKRLLKNALATTKPKKRKSTKRKATSKKPTTTKPTRQTYATGKSTKQLLSINDYSSLTPTDIRAVARRLVSVGNKRINRTVDKFGATTATERLSRNGGLFFSIRNKSDAEVMEEIKRIKGFMNDPTSTIKGANKVAKDTQDYLKNEGFENVDKLQIMELWSIYEQLKEIDPSVSSEERYKNVIKDVLKRLKTGGSYENTRAKLVKKYTKAYERNAVANSSAGGTSRSFE